MAPRGARIVSMSPNSSHGSYISARISELLSKDGTAVAVVGMLAKHAQSCDIFRIDQPLDEQLTIAWAFHIRPLLPGLDKPDRYAVLTLSQERVALFASTHTGLERVADVMPESFEKIAAELMVEPQTQESYHAY